MLVKNKNIIVTGGGNGLYWTSFMMGGYENYKASYDIAKKNGFIQAPGSPYKIKPIWFEQLADSNNETIENMKNYKGNLLLVYGGKDPFVPPVVSLAFKNAATKCDTIYLPDADHSLGLFDNMNTSYELNKQHIEGVTKWIVDQWNLK